MTRATSALALLISTAAPLAAQGAKLYITNQGGASVTVIDQDKLTVDTTLDLTKMGFTANAKPHHITVEPDGSFWYVTLIGDGKVVKLDRANHVVGQVSMAVPGLIMLDPKHDSLYVGRSMTATNPPKSLGVITRKDFKLVDEQEIQIPRPHALAMSRDGKWVFAGSLGENRFASVETATGHVTFSTLPGDVFRSLVQFTVSPDGKWLITGGEQSNTVMVFDLTKPPPYLPVKEFSIPAQTPAVGSKPWDPVFSRDGKLAYFSLFADSAIAEVDLAAGKVTRRLAQGLANPYDVILSRDGKDLFVVNQNLGTPSKPGESAHASMPGMSAGGGMSANGWLAVVDVKSGKVVKTLPLGLQPSGMGAAGAR